MNLTSTAAIKAGALLEALPYIQEFKDRTFVIKYGGSFMDSPNQEVRFGVVKDIAFLHAVGIKPVIVHGGGKAISKALEDAGIASEFVSGQRVTSADAVTVVDRVLSDEINPQIVGALREAGAKASGVRRLHRILRCRKLSDDLGHVGEVTDVKTLHIRTLMKDGVIPVISPIATDADKKVYNCNADNAAAQVAIALQADRLIFMSDVLGLMRDHRDAKTLISVLKVSEVHGLKQDGVISGGMIPKVDSAVEALKSGVGKVSMIDGRLRHSLMIEVFTDAGTGTEIVLK